MDLDRFKEVNDTLGHDVGDEVLKQVAAHFLKALPQAELTARLGGDEFAVLRRGADLHAALAASQQVHAALTPVVNIREIEIYMQASVGVALLPEHGRAANVLIRCAAVAMYNAKRQGLSLVGYSQEFDPFIVQHKKNKNKHQHTNHKHQKKHKKQPKVDL